MENRNRNTEDSFKASEWPRCEIAGGNCIGFDMVKILGQNVNRVLIEFLWNSNDGSRLTIQRNRQGFTAQVTGEVHRSTEDSSEFGLDQFRDLKRRLDSMNNSAD